jgi:hypothetical protein
MAALKVYSYIKAGELLREDAPLSVRTIERMVKAGDLERIGERARRGISERSIIAYQEGERGKWRENTSDASRTPATPRRPPTKRGQRSSPSLAVDTTSVKVSIPARLPKRGLIRS